MLSRLGRFRARRLAVQTSDQHGQSFPSIQARRNLAWQIQMRQRVNQMVPAGPGGVFNQEQAAELASVLIPAIAPMDHAWAVGLPRGTRPYVISMQQAFTLALINARVYQLQLENLYSAARSTSRSSGLPSSRSSTRACRR